jgi:hypothetical protein
VSLACSWRRRSLTRSRSSSSCGGEASMDAMDEATKNLGMTNARIRKT